MPKVPRQEDLFSSLLPRTMPLMALRSTIVFPHGTIAVQMGAPENMALLTENPEPGLSVALIVAPGEAEDPLDTAGVVNRIGVAARVHERINLPGHTVQITLQGMQRIMIEDVQQTEPYPVAIVRDARETPVDATDGRELITRVIAAAETLADVAEKISSDVPSILRMNVADPGRFADLAATNLGFRIADRDEVLQ
ncbi:MAG: LON peptidase substrate-binding domain-containing protein, partial [Gemmatimonadaceae bacterium]